MRIFLFLISLVVTVGLIYILNIQLPAGGSKTPLVGAFLSPQHGFWQNAEPQDIKLKNELHFSNLQARTDVYFDDRLVPHIYAENEDDAWFIQGYLHAKFRLWQMDFQTYAAAGRLSEILGRESNGTDFLAIDRFFRRLGMVYGAENSLKAMETNPVTKRMADRYTAGVNAYISSLKPNQYPVEYKLLNYKPELWTNLKTALLLKYMSWDLAGEEYDFEMTNAKNIFSAADFEKLYPLTNDSLRPIVPRGTLFPEPSVKVVKPATADSLYFHFKDSMDLPFSMKPDRDNGSNNWAVAGSKTKSGRPILCNDPHLGLNLPSLWYEIQITTPAFSTYGASLPGAPSVVIGFNENCAWGVTNAQRDVRDYYRITFRDTAMREYWFEGKWKKAGIRKEVIKVKGQPDMVENIAMTVFGPVMYDRHYANKFNDENYYAVRWKAHDASNELLTFNKLNRAKNYTDYEEAISAYECPGQNIIFASKSGDIAIRQQGKFPAKWRRQGDFVMPGTDNTYAWQGYIPQKENPGMLNPERGYVSSANQKPADDAYPYYLGGYYPLYRGLLINRMLKGMNSITPADMQRMQTNNYNVFAQMARPILLKNIDEKKLNDKGKKYVDAMRTWNLRNDVEETGATVFSVWWDSLEAAVWYDELGQSGLKMRWPDESTLLEALLRDSSFHFVDDIQTPAKESLPDMVSIAFKKAVSELEKADSAQKLAWGKFKDTGVRHLLKLPAFSRLHLPIGGGYHIINATKQYHGPSWRMVVQLTDKPEAYAVYPGGQSGNPGSRYYDNFVDTWVAGKYYTILFMNKAEASQSDKIKSQITFSK